MATVYFDNTRKRWMVRWIRHDGFRAQRQFRAEDDARAFAPTILDEERSSRRTGPKPSPMTPEALRANIRSRVTVSDAGCWIWPVRGGSNGYAQMTRRVTGKVTSFSMHRVSYEAFTGPIPEGLHLDHLCNTRKCINPAHLEPVTAAENNRRRDERTKALAS